MAGFSYAQAAKGPAPIAVPTPKLDAGKEQGTTAETNEPAALREEKPSVDGPAQADIERNDSEETLKIDDSADSVSKASTSKSQSISAASDPASPSLTESAATLIKDDDLHGNANDNANDSESTTWEKVSQGSQAQEMAASKSTADSDDSKTVEAWQKVTVPQPTLKEAPLPTINPWTKRAQDAQAKKAVTPIMPASSSAPQESQPRKKGRQSVSESNGPKLGEKNIKPDEVRRYKPSSETRLATRIPPPASDAVSWPTPDSAKLDDKDKDRFKSTSQDRGEPNEQDKDKMGGSKRAKTQWEHVDFVPTAVFNTPLPTSRRGGRGGARGGRDAGAGRGAPNPAGADHASAEEARTPSTEASVDRIRGDGSHARSGQAPPRAKRMSNAAQNKPRDLKRFDEAGRVEDIRAINGELVNGQNVQGTTEASAGSETGAVPQNIVGNGQPPLNAIETVDMSSSQEGRPRHHREERREHAGQGRDYNRDGNGAPREGRSERGGRGGHRGRGGSNNFPHGSHPASNGYAPPPFGTAKPHPYHERPGQYASFGSERGNKHYRSGSRPQHSQASTPSSRYSAFPPMPPSFVGGPVPPELGNNFGYPGMQPHFYHPNMDQAPLVAIIAEQMRYYFSLDNLVRDTYLRKRMDDQGFIPLDFMMPWRRMKMMTSDINLVRFAVQQVPIIELRLDVNGVDYIRPASEWQQWVLKREERLEEARNEGPNLQPNAPAPHQFPPMPMYQNQYPPMYAPQGYPQRHGSNRMMNGSPSHPEQIAAQYAVNGHSNGSPTQTPLSATVPEFQPNPNFSSQNLVSGNGQDPFTDIQMQNLTLITKASESSKPLTNGIHEHTNGESNVAGPETVSGPVLATPSDAE